MEANDFFDVMRHDLNEAKKSKKYKMSAGDLKEILNGLKFAVRDADKITDKKSTVIVDPPKDRYETRAEAVAVFMKYMASKGHKVTQESDPKKGLMPIVNTVGWKVKIKPPVATGEAKVQASDYENAIAAAWNDLHGIDHSIAYKEKIYGVSLKIAEALSKKETAPEGTAIAKGIGASKISDVSDFWKKYTGPRVDKTPKTDILIGEERLSLKMGNSALLCSGKAIKGEGSALLYHALRASSAGEELTAEIDRMFDDIRLPAGALKDAAAVEKYKGFHKIITASLRKFVEDHSDFQREFVREALTGAKKFEGVAKIPVADIVLAATFDGDKVMYKKIDNEYVDDIASQVKISVNFKTHGASMDSVIRANQEDIHGEIKRRKEKQATKQNKKEESTILGIMRRVADPNILTENDIMEFAREYNVDLSMSEGIEDLFKRIIGYLKTIAKKSIYLLLKLLKIDIEVDATISGINFFV